MADGCPQAVTKLPLPESSTTVEDAPVGLAHPTNKILFGIGFWSFFVQKV